MEKRPGLEFGQATARHRRSRASDAGVPDDLEVGESSTAILRDADLTAGSGSNQELRASRESRISYFMYFRIIAIGITTALVVAFQQGGSTNTFGRLYDQLTWSALFLAYVLNIILAWRLPRTQNLSMFAWVQTMFDIVLASIIVQLSGGTSSGAVFLFPVAVVGSAIMGDREQTLAATGGCVLIFTSTTLLHLFGLAIPLTVAGEVEMPAPVDFWTSYLLTIAATVSVGILSIYLNKQLVQFERQVSRLGALTDDMVRSLTSGLITVDTEGRVVFANAVALSYAGVHSLIGERIQDRFPSLSRGLRPSRGGLRVTTQIVQAPPEPPVQIEGICCTLRDADHHLLGYVLSLDDVTELVRMRTALERSQRLAAVGSLAASVAHEVRNPLAAISGSAELLGASVGDEREKLTNLILRESSRLASTVDNLLSYTRTHAPEVRRFNLPQLLFEVAEAVRSQPSSPDSGICIAVSGENVWTMSDPAQISQVIWNLMRNALEASPNDGKIQVRAYAETGYASFEIQDGGEGIDEEQIPLLFEPFFSTKPKGSGFGLAIVQRIVDEHGGLVSVISERGQGTTFKIQLPLADPVSE